MSDLFGNHFVGFSTRRLIFCLNKTISCVISWDRYMYYTCTSNTNLGCGGGTASDDGFESTVYIAFSSHQVKYRSFCKHDSDALEHTTQCISERMQNRRLRNGQTFTGARAFSRQKCFVQFFVQNCTLRMYCYIGLACPSTIFQNTIISGMEAL